MTKVSRCTGLVMVLCVKLPCTARITIFFSRSGPGDGGEGWHLRYQPAREKHVLGDAEGLIGGKECAEGLVCPITLVFRGSPRDGCSRHDGAESS